MDGPSALLGVEHEVVGDLLGAVGLDLWIEHQFGFDGAGDVVAVVRVAGEVQLRGEQFVSGRRYLDVQVGRAPGVPAGRGDQLAARTVGRDLVRRGPDGGDREGAVGAGGERAAQVPLR